MDELRIRITFTLGRSAATGDYQHKSQRYRYETFRTIIKRKVQKERRTTKQIQFTLIKELVKSALSCQFNHS